MEPIHNTARAPSAGLSEAQQQTPNEPLKKMFMGELFCFLMPVLTKSIIIIIITIINVIYFTLLPHTCLSLRCLSLT